MVPPSATSWRHGGHGLGHQGRTAGGSTGGKGNGSGGSGSGGKADSSGGGSAGGASGGLASCDHYDAGFKVGYACPRGAIDVQPDASLASLVTNNPAGTTFCLQPGTHHDTLQLGVGAAGDVFASPTGSITAGVIENAPRR